MQTLTIAGNIGKDAVIRTTQGGDKVAGFSVAVSNGKDKDASWFDCSLWGKRADALAPYLTKGTRVCITGRPTARAYEGKAYLGINVDQLTLLGGGQQAQATPGTYGDQPAGGGYDDDVIPF